ncbi:MAG: nuclear transport factor 2 family protein [Gammaproteobacteria bacterium]|nr:nuclear transport factor 2 family protein [Gammaproteobacteria bacterium]
MSDDFALEHRIAVLEDIEAIRQLKHRYFFACDRKRPAAIVRAPGSTPASAETALVPVECPGWSSRPAHR